MELCYQNWYVENINTQALFIVLAGLQILQNFVIISLIIQLSQFKMKFDVKNVFCMDVDSMMNLDVSMYPIYNESG